MSPEERLLAKLLKLEALFERPGSDGEKQAAGCAIDRIKTLLRETTEKENPIPFKCSLADDWFRMLFCALCRRYGLKPYRRYRQRYTTVMVDVPKSFMDNTLWPKYEALADTLNEYLKETTKKLISTAVHKDTSDTEVVSETMALPSGRMSEEQGGLLFST